MLNVKYMHHDLKGKFVCHIEIPPQYAVALLYGLGQSHLRFCLLSLPRTVSSVMCRLDLWRNPRRSRRML